MWDDVANFIEVDPAHLAEVPPLWWDTVLDGRLFLIKPEEFPFRFNLYEFRTFAYRRAQARQRRASVTLEKRTGNIYLQTFPLFGHWAKWSKDEALLPPLIPKIQRRLAVGVPLDKQGMVRVALVAPADENPGLQWPAPGSTSGAVRRKPQTREEFEEAGRWWQQQLASGASTPGQLPAPRNPLPDNPAPVSPAGVYDHLRVDWGSPQMQAKLDEVEGEQY